MLRAQGLGFVLHQPLHGGLAFSLERSLHGGGDIDPMRRAVAVIRLRK